MATRKHLTDLYQTGREIEFSEGEQPVMIPELDAEQQPIIDEQTGKARLTAQLDEFDEPVLEPVFVEKVWVSKLTTLDHKAAVRRADAAKALVLSSVRDKDGPEWAAALGMVEETCGEDRDLMLEFLVADRLAQRQEAIGAEIEGEEVDGDDGPEPSEWKKDNYLQGLFDAWNGGDGDEDSLRARYAQNPDDPEAKHVLAEMSRYLELVNARMDEEREEFLVEIRDLDLDQLRYRIAALHLEARSNQVWFEEFNCSRIFLGLRKPDKHADYYLKSREDVEKLHPTIAQTVLAAVEEMAVDVTEGKGLPATRTSSR